MKRIAPLNAQQLPLAFDEPALAPSAPPVPRGARRPIVGNAPIHYGLRRARRRSIGFTIDDQGLTVAAPRWVGLAEIEAAIAEKERWIRRKLTQWREWRARQPLQLRVDSASERRRGVEIPRAEISPMEILTGEQMRRVRSPSD